MSAKERPKGKVTKDSVTLLPCFYFVEVSGRAGTAPGTRAGAGMGAAGGCGAGGCRGPCGAPPPPAAGSPGAASPSPGPAAGSGRRVREVRGGAAEAAPLLSRHGAAFQGGLEANAARVSLPAYKSPS